MLLKPEGTEIIIVEMTVILFIDFGDNRKASLLNNRTIYVSYSAIDDQRNSAKIHFVLQKQSRLNLHLNGQQSSKRSKNVVRLAGI